MEIIANTTGMPAAIAVVPDKEGRDHCVVVVKGTFFADPEGSMQLSPRQAPPVATDEHYGNPESTPVCYENDFALTKLLTDIVVVGKAVAPGGVPTKRLAVRLEVQGKVKDAVVYGDRRWIAVAGSASPSNPAPFLEMPLTFDRAFGGSDDSRGLGRVDVEVRNLCGVGYHPHRKVADVVGQPVPNIEHPAYAVRSPRRRVPPIGFGCIGRTWAQRTRYAGTYDEQWLEHHAPYLPPDFDERYFQCAPEDQRFPLFEGGEIIRCVNMAPDPVVTYRMPDLRVPVRFTFKNHTLLRRGRLDTIVLEPHARCARLTWRISVPLPKKVIHLRAVSVGDVPDSNRDRLVGYRDRKPIFAGIDATVRWLQKLRRGEGL